IELFRHHGSLFIRRIAEVFEWCSHHDDISELFSKVLEFPMYFEKQRRPIIGCTMTKRFYPSMYVASCLNLDSTSSSPQSSA
ncbi:hypothetical protein XENOCAPTIV_025037, partial [Xenoophorus captivus]